MIYCGAYVNVRSLSEQCENVLFVSFTVWYKDTEAVNSSMLEIYYQIIQSF